jgi:hypothetical protein
MPLRLYRTFNAGVPADAQPPVEPTPVPPVNVENVLTDQDGRAILTDDLQYILVEA